MSPKQRPAKGAVPKVNLNIVSVQNQLTIPRNPSGINQGVISPRADANGSSTGSSAALPPAARPRVTAKRRARKCQVDNELAKTQAARQHRENEQRRHKWIIMYTNKCVELLPPVVEEQEPLKEKTQKVVAYVCFLEQKIDDLCAELNLDRGGYRHTSVKESTLRVSMESAATSNLDMATFEPVTLLNAYLRLLGLVGVTNPRSVMAEDEPYAIAANVETEEEVAVDTQATVASSAVVVENTSGQAVQPTTELEAAVSNLLAEGPDSLNLDPESPLFGDQLDVPSGGKQPMSHCTLTVLDL